MNEYDKEMEKLNTEQKRLDYAKKLREEIAEALIKEKIEIPQEADTITIGKESTMQSFRVELFRK